jgi:hypothetical protein
MTFAFFVAGTPILVLLWASWIAFTGWTFRRPHIQALLGVIFIIASIWLKHGNENLDWLRIPGLHEGLKITGEILDATLAPIGGGLFATAILVRSQLLSAREVQDTKESLIDRITLHRSLKFAMYQHVSRRHSLPKAAFDDDYERLDRSLDRSRNEIRRMQKILRESGERVDVAGIGDLLDPMLGQRRRRI